MSKSDLVTQVSFINGWLVETSQHDTGEVTYDVAFPAEPGQTRLLSDMLGDLAARCRDEHVHVQVRITIDVRSGLEVRDGLDMVDDLDGSESASAFSPV